MNDNINFDWEYEAKRDYIFILEREKDMEESYQKWVEKNNRKPAKIIFNENHIRKSSFRRTFKKILQFRSHLSTKTSS
jgi:hypothetical protein